MDFERTHCLFPSKGDFPIRWHREDRPPGSFLVCFSLLFLHFVELFGWKKQIKRFGFLLAFLGGTRQILLPGASWLCLLPPGLGLPARQNNHRTADLRLT